MRRSHGLGNGLFRYFAASLYLALALSETFPRFRILALLLLPSRGLSASEPLKN
jgi:hypothetical protein